jgi:phage-related protein
MIYHDAEEDKYTVGYFKDKRTGRIPVKDYIKETPHKDRSKILKYIEFLRKSNGILDEPYSRHIRGKVRELRVDFADNRHRIFYFTFIGRNIVFLHAFRKNTAKTPESEIIKAENNLNQVINSQESYVD